MKQPGLEWHSGTFGLTPRWTKEPRHDIIQHLIRAHLQLDHEVTCEVTLFAQGAFNKLYRVNTSDPPLLVRVVLPVDPHFKTSSEVSTIKFIAQKTNVPVPKIYAYDDSMDNSLEFEWIMMDLVCAKPMRTMWRKLQLNQKKDITRQMAKFQADIFEHKFNSIANLYSSEANISGIDSSNLRQTTDFQLGRIVSLTFFWGDHLSYTDVERGPFKNSHDWLEAELSIVLIDQNRILKKTKDEDEIEDAQNSIDIAQRLLKMLPTIFPPEEVEETSLFHDDLSMQNILVDDEGKVTCIVDWECVSLLPLWRCCQVPGFLHGRVREEEPDRENYFAADSDDEESDGLDNEGVNSLFWEHLLEYEQTQLRRIFVAEMEGIQPIWGKIFRDSAFKSDFEVAVHNCDNGFCLKILRDWLDGQEQGNQWCLRDRLVQ